MLIVTKDLYSRNNQNSSNNIIIDNIRMQITIARSRGIMNTAVIAFALILMLSFSLITQNSVSFVISTVYAQPIKVGEPTFPDNGPQTDKNPKFLDSYWTDNLSTSISVPGNNTSTKKEVGPGEGASTLAVVLVNNGRSDITGITGYLSLPSGFKPIPGKDNGTLQSVTSFYSTAKAGQTFILYFDIYVSSEAKVGAYSGLLSVKYSKILQVGEIISTMKAPFRLPGKVVLDAFSTNNKLVPGTLNELDISLQNKGSANATGAVVSIAGITDTSGGSTTSNSSTTKADKTQSLPLVTVGNSTFDVGIIPHGKSVLIKPVLYSTSSAGETAHNLVLEISYGDAYGSKRKMNILVGLAVSPDPPRSVLSITSKSPTHNNTSILAAGKIQDLNFTLVNNDKKPITNLVISLVSGSGSVKILGDSRWTIQIMNPQSRMNLSTKVFSSEDMIGKPAMFTVTARYLSRNQSQTDNLNLGAYITGIIKIRVYDIAINYIGNRPNLMGNLLNEGNTVGLFTTIEMLKPPYHNKSSISNLPVLDSSYTSSLQYLGDLSKDSPLPFSIPLEIDNNTVQKEREGVYLVSLKITYNDDLRVPHELIVNKKVNLELKQKPPGTEAQNLGFIFGTDQGLKSLIIITIIAIAAIIIALVFIIKRIQKKRRLKSRLDELSGSRNMDLFSSKNSITSNDRERISKDIKFDRKEEEGSDKTL
jgi:hypothetical protein